MICLICVLRAYGPGEFKVLSSGDGGNFEEAASWRSATRSEVSYLETVMFDHTINVKSLSLVMKAPMHWGYFGLNDVSLLVEPYPFMILSGATSPTGERCVTATDVGLSNEDCLDAIAAGDGREVFRQEGDQIVHTVSHLCVALTDSSARRVGLQDCETATRAQDGRSDWILTSAAQLKMVHVGNYCLTLNGGLASAEDCGDALVKGDAADKYFLAAVPELDLRVAAGVKNGASLLAAATSRQRKNLVNLQAVLPSLEMCKFSSFATNVTHVWNTKAFPRAGVKLATEMHSGVTDMAMMAISKIYPSIGADMADTMQLIRESSATLLAAEGKLVGKVS